jgi:serine/threonine-protein kinase
MICKKFPNQEHVKVLDFGVAKLFGTWHNLDKFATAPGNVLGTPLYMSPEQVVGSPLDGRSDIYSLGCVLYQCLCGVPPISGKSAVEVMQNHVALKPKNLNDNGASQFPEELNSIVQKAIAKKREERYDSMGEFAETMRQFVMPPLLYWLWSKYDHIYHHKKHVSPALKSMSRRSRK